MQQNSVFQNLALYLQHAPITENYMIFLWNIVREKSDIIFFDTFMLEILINFTI